MCRFPPLCARLALPSPLPPPLLRLTPNISCSPICYAWEGGKLLAHSPDYDEMVVTRDDYEENGHCICEEKFDI